MKRQFYFVSGVASLSGSYKFWSTTVSNVMIRGMNDEMWDKFSDNVLSHVASRPELEDCTGIIILNVVLLNEEEVGDEG